jgi:hypothetical protein
LVAWDWWAFGEKRWGERKAIVEAEDWDGPSFQAAADAASVCRKFETSRRREVLSFNHHREVAALPPDEADALLDSCEEPIKTPIIASPQRNWPAPPEFLCESDNEEK